MSSKLTIITINYNNADGLRRTLNSVITQKDVFFEHIIVDGASTDESLNVIKDYLISLNEKECNNILVRWVSEPDLGIYNAMNKGIRMSKGEYLLFLNSGDVFANENVVRKFYDASVSAEIVSGIEQMPNGSLVYPKNEEELTYSYFYDDTLLHQSTFIRRDAFERYGLYNECYRIVSDWEWFFRVLIRENATYQALDFIVAIFDVKGISNQHGLLQLHNKEREKVRQTILPRLRSDYFKLKGLQKKELEFDYLKNGKMGWFVCFLIKLKGFKKR